MIQQSYRGLHLRKELWSYCVSKSKPDLMARESAERHFSAYHITKTQTQISIGSKSKQKFTPKCSTESLIAIRLDIKRAADTKL